MQYVIGEIILVVIGILIALSINNWNEASKNEALGTNYLIRISKDLENDLLEFDDAHKLAQQRKHRVSFLQEAINKPELVLDSTSYFIQSIITAGYTFNPTISNHSFEELKSSGRLALIEDEKLRVSIAKYYDFAFNHTQWDFLSKDTQLKYNEYLRGILNQEQLNWVLSNYYDPELPFEISKRELDDIYQRFKSKKDFHYILQQTYSDKHEAIQYMLSAMKSAEDLKQEILDELSTNSKNE